MVVGAAGGIGAAAAEAFLHEGATVGLVDLPGPRLTALAERLGAGATALAADITDEDSVRSAFHAWQARHARLSVLYVCSGVQLHDSDGPVHRTTLATWQATFAVNATGTFLACKHAVPLMRESGGGSIVLCGSPTAMTMSGCGYAAYAASKGALTSLARVIAADYAADGIRCNVVVPGPVRTPLIETLLADDRVRHDLEAGTPLGRLAEPADLVGVAVFLASRESAYATAGIFPVDGGVTAR